VNLMFPILEFDPEKKAFIEPSAVNDAHDIPECCVICFFKDVLDRIIENHQPKLLVENSWEDGSHDVYELDVNGKRLAFYHSGVGAAVTGGLMEEVIAFGCRKFIACGGCGVLEKDVPVGHLFILSGAVRDEGVSYHYLPPSREVSANQRVLKKIARVFQQRNIPFRIAKTWTTDAPYRETSARIKKRREEGCAVVEMEAAGMMAVAEFRGIDFGQIVYSGDDLSGKEWDSRGWQSKREIRESLFWLCADACLTL